jgi:hypothetical protein
VDKETVQCRVAQWLSAFGSFADIQECKSSIWGFRIYKQTIRTLWTLHVSYVKWCTEWTLMGRSCLCVLL